MRQYAWYSPELNVIVLHCIMEDCWIAFEWASEDLWEMALHLVPDPMIETLWLPLGEL